MAEFYEMLLKVSGEAHVKVKEAMGKHTTFQVGGPADFFVSPEEEKELADITALCRRESVPFFILGNGSNLLVGDGGVEGVVISTEKFTGCRADKEKKRIIAGAGVSLGHVASAACEASLAGFEFASGIPGTVGGAVVMNAGAYGSAMKEVLESVKVLTPEGEIKELTAEELELGYRTSCIIPRQYVVVEAAFHLKEGVRTAIKEQIDELTRRRTEKQPLEYPSAGSTFKRPEGHYAGVLIDEAGLRGFALGGAQVSEKHCGFVINKNRATAADVVALCEEVKKRVYQNSGVKLEMEVKTLGRF